MLALRADFTAAMEAFDSHAFKDMNIMANRILSDIVFGGQEYRKYILTGHILKTISGSLAQTSGEGYDTVEIHNAVEKILNKLQETLHNPISNADVWNTFAEYESGSRLLRCPPSERKAYKEANPQFTRLLSAFLFENILPDIDTMCRVDGGIVQSSSGDFERAIRTNGCELRELILHSVFITFSRVFDYLYFESMPPTGNFDSTGMKAKVEPYLKTMLETYAKIKKGEDPVTIGNPTIEQFCEQWRILFLKYNEISRPGQQAQAPRIELPKAAKDQISESLKRAIQADLAKAPRAVPQEGKK